MHRRLAVTALAFVAFASASQAVPASAAGVSLAGAPAAVHLATGEARNVALVISNDGDAEVTDLRLAAPVIDGSGVTAKVVPLKRSALKAGAATKVTLQLSATEELPAERSITLLARYRQAKIAKITTATIKVEPPAPFDPAKVATMSVNAALDSVLSGSTNRIIVTIANASSHPLRIGGLRLTLPSALEVAREDAEGRRIDQLQPRRVEPYDTLAIPIDVTATERVHPGKHQIVVTAPVRIAPQGQRFSLSATKEASVSVKGESAIVAAFGGSALVLLPGALTLGLIAMLWKLRVFRHRSAADADIEFDVKSAPFIALTVGTSFGIVWLWSKLPWGTDLFEYYGLDDILRALIFSAAFGAVAYTVPMGLVYWAADRRTPKTGDDASTVLRKLHRQGLGTLRPTLGAAPNELFVLERDDLERKRGWACPPIEIAWSSPPPAPARPQASAAISDAEWQEQIDAWKRDEQEWQTRHGKADAGIRAALSERNASALADILDAEQRAGTLTATFAAVGTHTGPYLMSETEFAGARGPAQAIVRYAQDG